MGYYIIESKLLTNPNATIHLKENTVSHLLNVTHFLCLFSSSPKRTDTQTNKSTLFKGFSHETADQFLELMTLRKPDLLMTT